jgi:hypothetical protein
VGANLMNYFEFKCSDQNSAIIDQARRQ